MLRTSILDNCKGVLGVIATVSSSCAFAEKANTVANEKAINFEGVCCAIVGLF
jgi:hypothetical protein